MNYDVVIFQDEMKSSVKIKSQEMIKMEEGKSFHFFKTLRNKLILVTPRNIFSYAGKLK